MSAYLPDTLMTKEVAAARLRETGLGLAAEALAAGIAGPRFTSHQGVTLFRWGDVIAWAYERREDQGLEGFFEDPAEAFARVPEGIAPRPWINANNKAEVAGQ
jgi:hypothetical protein